MTVRIFSRRANTQALLAAPSLEPSFIDVAQENLFLQRLLLVMGASVALLAGALVVQVRFTPAHAFFVFPSGEAFSLAPDERMPQEAGGLARLAIREIYEIEPWNVKGRDERASQLGNDDFSRAIANEAHPPDFFRRFVVERANVRDESGMVTVELSGIRFLGLLGEPNIGEEKITLVVKFTKTERHKRNPYGFEIINIIEEKSHDS